MIVHVTINGEARNLAIEPGATLLDALREHGYMGVKRGCETGSCGACVVLLDGEPHCSCLLFAAVVGGREITTIEALDEAHERGKPHPILSSFVEEAGVQCGYCVPGMALSAKALIDSNPRPTEADVREALDGHLCRCTGYVKQIKAVLRAASILREEVR